MSPLPTVGVISTTKYTQPDDMVTALATLQPGTTTAGAVEALLNAASGSTPGPLYNDIVRYDPPILDASDRSRAGVVVDDELLRACRGSRDDARLLLWCALNLADRRLDHITRTILTDTTGHLRSSVINRTALRSALGAAASTWQEEPDLPHDGKTVSNILRLLDKCGLITPTEDAGSITGIERTLPTRHAVPGLLVLISERLAQYRMTSVPGATVDFALGLGANHWLNLSPEEFRLAATAGGVAASQTPTPRQHLPDDLFELEQQLRRRRQVVLQGPPGVGKTYVARSYVRWSTADRVDESRLQAIITDLPVNERTPTGIAQEVARRGLNTVWDIVQFHPGYDYTDFVRALVAEPVDGGVTFTARHKTFSLMAAVGTQLRTMGAEVDQVLILDEVNRGDIANIFGELLYALEYRDEPVSTPYTVDGQASIEVPSTLLLIGTMNTADRSIAVIDYALRRRFVFLDLPATSNAIRNHSDYPTEALRSAATRLFEQTQEALVDTPSGLQVGPSYFLTRDDTEAAAFATLASRFVYEVIPLLREYALEGELEEGRLTALVAELGLDETAPQAVASRQLAEYLARPQQQAPEAAQPSADAAGATDVVEDVTSTTSGTPSEGDARPTS